LQFIKRGIKKVKILINLKILALREGALRGFLLLDIIRVIFDCRFLALAFLLITNLLKQLDFNPKLNRDQENEKKKLILN
jgi:hypothetical protein